MHQNLFQKAETAQLLIATILKYRDAGEFRLHDFVVMPNHLHAVLSVDDGKTVGRAVQLIRAGSRVRCIRREVRGQYGSRAITNIVCEIAENTNAFGAISFTTRCVGTWQRGLTTTGIRRLKPSIGLTKYPKG